MRSLSTVGLALSLVFGCFLLALVAELYYLLWWKNSVCRREVEEDDYISPSRELLHKFCLEKRLFFSSAALSPQQVCSSTHREPPSLLSNKDLWGEGAGGVEDELKRVHGLSGPPRFLFTIKEETMEDLEKEEGRSRKGSRDRSLSDEVFFDGETPYLTPIASPPYYTPPLTPMDTIYKHHGFNPLFETSNEAEFCKLRFSPPPRFEFLKDAEDELYRKKLKEKAASECPTTSSVLPKDEEDGSFIALIVAKDKDREFSVVGSNPGNNLFLSKDKTAYTRSF